MTKTKPVWMTRREHLRLQAELAALQSQFSFDVPAGKDHDKQLLAAYKARQARIDQIENLLAAATVADDSSRRSLRDPAA